MTNALCPGGSFAIGMLHIPINTILSAPEDWRRGLELPSATGSDWEKIVSLRMPGDELGLADGEGEQLEIVRSLSFFGFLAERVCSEAAIYRRHGLEGLMIENTGAPYHVRGLQPAVVYWMMRALALRLRKEQSGVPLGIQVLAYSDDWAMEIAVRCGMQFVRTESALFAGMRPEGRSPNQGNLAQLYMQRERLMAQASSVAAAPLVFADLLKKHTVFPLELRELEIWLENVIFMKLEGVLITGAATGLAPGEEDLRRAREAIDAAREKMGGWLGEGWRPLLLAGSGVTRENAALFKKLVDGVIVGSTLKRNGYWECPVDEEAVKRFTEGWKG